MEVVCVLNAMYVAFDELCQKNRIYKVRSVCRVSYSRREFGRGNIPPPPPPLDIRLGLCAGFHTAEGSLEGGISPPPRYKVRSVCRVSYSRREFGRGNIPPPLDIRLGLCAGFHTAEGSLEGGISPPPRYKVRSVCRVSYSRREFGRGNIPPPPPRYKVRSVCRVSYSRREFGRGNIPPPPPRYKVRSVCRVSYSRREFGRGNIPPPPPPRYKVRSVCRVSYSRREFGRGNIPPPPPRYKVRSVCRVSYSRREFGRGNIPPPPPPPRYKVRSVCRVSYSRREFGRGNIPP